MRTRRLVLGGSRCQSTHSIGSAPITRIAGHAPASSHTLKLSPKIRWVESVSDGKRAFSRSSTSTPRWPSRAASVEPATRPPTITTSWRTSSTLEQLDRDEPQRLVARVLEVVDQLSAGLDVEEVDVADGEVVRLHLAGGEPLIPASP